MNMRCLRGQTPFCVAASAPRWKPLQLLTSAYFAVAHPDRGFAGNSLTLPILVSSSQPHSVNGLNYGEPVTVTASVGDASPPCRSPAWPHGEPRHYMQARRRIKLL